MEAEQHPQHKPIPSGGATEEPPLLRRRRHLPRVGASRSSTRPGLPVRYSRHGIRPACPPPASGQGRGRQPLFRIARRRRLGACRGPVARSLQSRVPARLRRVAARVPADQALGARCRAHANHRPVSRRHLLLGGIAERRLVHDELYADIRHVPDDLPRELSAGGPTRTRPIVCPPRSRAPATPHVSRRQAPRAALAWSPTVPSTPRSKR
jgi:hypothetical protein